ncbi:BTAD domain-containing putative transcriptional regulator [Klenkia sp. LSe6-5]|uniref:BTAD domain-containing putative transcriptional regulator n=1 Tax=Klenkia sesuvii TaxID=3103137 RepID=A0ABU8E1I3_9ACTN
MGLEFRVLGAVQALRDGSPVDLGGPRQRSVVARLLVAGGHVVPADVLVADLWHAETPPRALAALQAHISHLRRALEPDRPPRTPAQLLVTVPPGYALRPDPGTVDVLRSVRAVEDGDRLGATDPDAARERWTAALQEWRGPAYAEFAGEPWAVPEVARLEELRLSTVERCAATALAAPSGRDPLPQLRAHVAEHPLREEGWRLLALALYRSGRQGEALEALRTARRRLADELGVDPGPALRALEDGVLAQAPHLTPAPASPARPPAARHPAVEPVPATGPELVGREAELGAVRAAADGDGVRVLLVPGGPGSGKSALAGRVAADLAAEGWRVLPVRCPESDGAPSGWPWSQALRRLAVQQPPGDPRPLAPLLEDFPSDPAGDPTGNRFRMHRAVVDWLAGVASGAPLLVVVDDLHRADEETAALLLALVRGLPRLLVVATTREEPTPVLSATRADLGRLGAQELPLGPLAPAAVADLVARTSAVPLDPEVVAAVVDRAEGNPFHVRELVRLAGTGADVGRVPGTVRDVVRHRCAVLPAPATSLLRLAAVCGRDVDADVLLAAAGEGDGDEVLDALDTVLVSGLLVEPGPGRLRFGHVLVRDTLYDDLSSVRRRRLHGRVADTLARMRPGDVTALAHHQLAAGDPHTAAGARSAAAAAELAERHFAHRDAAAWWGRAHEATAGDPAARIRLAARRTRALALAGDVPAAVALRAATLPAALGRDDAELVAEVVLSVDVPTLWSSRTALPDPALVGAVEQVLPRLADRPDLRSRLLGVLALELEGEPGAPGEQGYAASLDAVALARGCHDPVVLAHALNARYLQTYRYGGLAERHALGTELLDLAQRHGLGLFEAGARLVLVQACCGSSDLDAADRHVAEASRLAEAYGLPLLAGVAAWYGGLRLAVAGRRPEAETVWTAAVEAVGSTGFHADQARALWWLCLLCLRVSEGDTADLVEQTRAVADVSHQDLDAAVALALALDGDHAGARALATGLQPVRPDYFTPVFLGIRGWLGLAVGDRDLVEQAYTGLLPHEGTVCAAWTASIALGPTATLLARLAAHRGDRAAARAHQRVAVEVARATGNPRWVAAARDALG